MLSCWILTMRLIQQCNIQTSHLVSLLFTSLDRFLNQQVSTFQHLICYWCHVMSWLILSTLSWGHFSCLSSSILSSSSSSFSDSDEASLVTADWLWYHAATSPPGHTSLPVEFCVTPKPWNIIKTTCYQNRFDRQVWMCCKKQEVE